MARGLLVRPAALPAGPGVRKALELGCVAVIYSGANITKRYAAAARDAGLMVLEYTVNTRLRLRRSLGMGVDGIITDVPAEMARLVGLIGRPGGPGQAG
jgi:glycerophosphoryl diester phosphodiesterase